MFHNNASGSISNWVRYPERSSDWPERSSNGHQFWNAKSGLPRFYLSGIVLDESHNRTEAGFQVLIGWPIKTFDWKLLKCVGHSQMSKADHIMHFCWCIYVLIFFYVLPTLVSISSSCFLWCKVKPYDFGTVINSSDSVNDRVGLESSLRSRSWTTAKYNI